MEEMSLLENCLDQTAILGVVASELPRLLAVEAAYLEDSIFRFLDPLPPPEELAGDRLEAEVLEAPGGGPEGIDAVEDRSSGNAGHSLAPGRSRREDRRPVFPAPHGKRQVETLTNVLQHLEVKVHDVPAEDDVGVGAREKREEFLEERRFVVVHRDGEVLFGIETLAMGVAPLRMAKKEHPRLRSDGRADGVKSLVEPVGLDVEGQDREPGPILRGREPRVSIFAIGRVLDEVALDAKPPGHEVLHEEAIRGLQVRLVEPLAPFPNSSSGVDERALALELQRVDEISVQPS